MPVVEAVGVSVSNRVPRAKQKQHAMRDAVLEAVREGVKDPAEIKRRMLEARDRVRG